MNEDRYHCPTPGCKAEEYVFYCFAGVDPEPELGVLVDVEGNATNRWEDGTVGVPEDVKAWIQMDDCPPYCPIHDEATEWRCAVDGTPSDPERCLSGTCSQADIAHLKGECS